MTIQEFLDSIGVETPLTELTLDGTMKYLNDPAGFKGWYRGTINKFGTFLQFGDWRNPKPEIFKETPAIPSDPVEKAAWEKAQKLQQEADAKHVLEVQERVSKDSIRELSQFSKEGQSLYLTTKGVRGWGVYYRFPSRSNAKETDLIVPVRDINEKVWGYQVISPYGDKDLIPGGRLGACFHLLGEKIESIVYVAEGYATAASVYEVTGKPSVCAFNAGNIPKVCKAIREKHPDAKIVIAADNDDAGLAFAKEASKEFDAIVVSPPKKEGDLDWNDFHKKFGKEATQKLLTGRSIEFRDRANLISAVDFINEPDVDIYYIVEELLPQGGTSVFAGQPKVGKTTTVRDLIRCVAGGTPFLGRKTVKGKVVYLALEEKDAFLRKKFKKFALEELQNIQITFWTSAKDKLDELQKIIEKYKPSLLVVDTMYKFIPPVEDKYAEMVQVLAPFDELAREYGTHIMLIHHAKKGESKGVESVLGSTAIAGAFDTILTQRKQMIENEEHRIISSTNRYGRDIEDMVITYDEMTEKTSVKKAPTKEDSGKMKILQFFKENPGQWFSPQQAIDAGCPGRFNTVKDACYDLQRSRMLLYQKGDRGSALYSVNPDWVGTVKEGDAY